nr:hypothetical protein [Marinilabilia rubra]
MSDLKHHIELIKQFFRCREYVLAIRWEKGNKKGYMPAYSYDPYAYMQHKFGGGTLATFKDKTRSPLTQHEIKLHLEGKQFIGIYPLLEITPRGLLLQILTKKTGSKNATCSTINAMKTESRHALSVRGQGKELMFGFSMKSHFRLRIQENYLLDCSKNVASFPNSINIPVLTDYSQTRIIYQEKGLET